MISSVKIDITPIKEQVGQVLEYSREVKIPPITGLTFEEPWKLNVKVNHTYNGYYVSGSVKGKYTAVCDRCLETFSRDLAVELNENFVPRREEAKEDDRNFEGDEIDLTDTIVEAISLSIPMKKICSEECRGLCPTCGINLNLQSCTCADDNIDYRLAKLAVWKEEKGGSANGQPQK